MGRILVVDDEAGLRGMLDIILRRDGHQVIQAANGQEALKLIGSDPTIELVLSDLRMEQLDGLGLLAQVRQYHPDILVIIMTAFAEWDTAVRAMRQGAYNFLRKPFDNQVVRALVGRALDARGHYLATRSQGSAGQPPAVHLVGQSRSIQQIQTTIEQVSTTDSTVLVTGESGTGKELVARAVHYASMRSDGPLVRINSGALAPSLLESELFGHVKGSFTGAIEDRQGLFALADGGTLFLDEVGELAAETQVKLLRVLEIGEYLPVGGREVKTCNVRIVAATNRDLSAMVKSGDFREDLYYRLAVIPLHLPPLRERREDIPLLAGHLLARHAVKLRRGITGFTQDALDAMLGHAWPGNIRELDNRIQRGAALTDTGDISYNALFGDLSVRPVGATAKPSVKAGDELRARIGLRETIDLEKELADYERSLMEAALTVTDDNLTEAAKLLGISFRQIRYKVRQLGLR
ncbi:MAG: sigma-54-dependent Fis family transcriptional regulator [Planctomycetes bacterium]|nr:sigma-54-dependent Fis family transcriptional regulator [Planctomycetota bacterium]